VVFLRINLTITNFLSMPQVSRKRGREYVKKSEASYKRTRYGRYGKKPRTLAQKVQRLIQSQERKWLDTKLSGSVAPGLVTPLNLVPQGDDSVSRDGRKISIRSLLCMLFDPNQAHGTSPWRYAIVWDKQPNGALAAATDIFDTTTYNAVPNLNNRNRFMILYDSSLAKKTGAMPVGNNAGLLQWSDQHYLAMEMDTIFNSTATATIAAITTGALLMVYLGGVNSSAAFDSTFRIRFVDS